MDWSAIEFHGPQILKNMIFPIMHLQAINQLQKTNQTLNFYPKINKTIINKNLWDKAHGLKIFMENYGILLIVILTYVDLKVELNVQISDQEPEHKTEDAIKIMIIRMLGVIVNKMDLIGNGDAAMEIGMVNVLVKQQFLMDNLNMEELQLHPFHKMKELIKL